MSHYSCDDIRAQLRDFSKQEYFVQQPVTISNIESAIEEMCGVTHFNNSLSSKVLPINICSDKCNHGPQWVGLVITYEENTCNAFFVDAIRKCQCETAFNIGYLKGILTKNNINVHVYYKLGYTYYDSGPLTVIILDKFVRTKSFLETISEEDIKNVRERLTKLKDDYSILERSTKNFNISIELIREIKESNLDKSKKRDIKIIMETLRLLENTTETENTAQRKLSQIGHLFSRITNDENNENIIRNKYGCSERNYNGIPFDHFYHLKKHFDHENQFNEISQDDMNIFENYLPILERKLMDILKNEKDFVDNKHFLDQIDLVSEKNGEDSKLFIVTVVKYLKLQISSNIDEVKKLLDGLEFESDDDKHKLARILTIIGESANKLEKCLTNQQIMNTKFLYSIRNKIIHYHQRIMKEPLNIDLIISVIRDVHDNSENDEEEILRKRKELLKHLKYKPQKAKEETKPKNNADIQCNLDVLLFKAAKICRGIFKYSNKEKGLKKLNENYQSQLSLLNGSIKECFPKALHLNYENEICLHSKNNVPIPSRNKFQLELKKIDDSKILNKNLVKSKISEINNECNYLINVINKESIDSNKQRYIISHSIMIIMQYVRDLNTIDYYDNLNNFSNEIKILFNEHFQNFLQNEILNNDDNSIRYIYTSSNIQYCPIIALVFCNIGVSLAKLTMYEQSIEFLKKAAEYIVEFNNIIFSNDLTINKNKIENEIYQLSFNRIFAKVLHLAKRFDDSLNVFDKINKRIQFENINEYSDINLKNEIIQFYLDYSLLLIDQKKFNDADEICKLALKLDSNNADINFRLLESYCKNENFINNDLVDNLVNVLVNNSQDDGEKCNILNKFVIFCLLCPNIENGIKKAEIYLNKMENIIIHNDGSFNEVYHQKFIQLKLVVLLGKSRINQSIENISYVLNLEFEITNLINEIKLKNHPLINWTYLSLCYIYSNYAKTTGEQKHIVDAKKYFEIILSKNLPIDNNQTYLATVIKFSETYIDYYIHKSNDINMEILIKELNFSIDLQMKFKIRYSLILRQLIKLFDIVYEKSINNATGNNDLQQCLKLLTKKIIFITYLDDDSDLICLYLKQRAICCSKLADSLFDMKFMKEAVFYYENVLLHMLPVNEIIDYYNKKEDYEKKINIYKTLLENILISNFDFQVNQRFIDRFNETFGLTLEIENGRLKLINMDSIPEETLKLIMNEKEYFERPYPLI